MHMKFSADCGRGACEHREPHGPPVALRRALIAFHSLNASLCRVGSSEVDGPNAEQFLNACAWQRGWEATCTYVRIPVACPGLVKGGVRYVFVIFAHAQIVGRCGFERGRNA